MYQFVLFIHVFVAVSVILLVLIQQGKGATVGSAFGAGASQTVFGSRGSSSFLLKLTVALIIVFFSTSIFLNVLLMRDSKMQPSASAILAPSVPQDKASPVKPTIHELQKTMEKMPVLPVQVPER